MEHLIKQIVDLKGVKGVWYYSKSGEYKQKLLIPLDINTSTRLKAVLLQLFTIFQSNNLNEFIVGASEYDYFIFKKIKTYWLVIWAKRTESFSLLKMEIEIILNKNSIKKGSFIKKLKFW